MLIWPGETVEVEDADAEPADASDVETDQTAGNGDDANE
jgi:hypothetical protein